MPQIENPIPETLRPYENHGVSLTWRDPKGEALGNCPFCGRENKFSVTIENGVWRCLVCGIGSDKGGGNAYTFIRLLWEHSDKATTDYSEIMEHRKILMEDSLMAWGICRSIISGEWLVPGYTPDGKMNQLYRYVLSNKTLYPTFGLGHWMFGAFPIEESKSIIDVTEGAWDGVTLWEVFRHTKMADHPNGDGIAHLSMTSNQNVSLLNERSIIGVPGCGSVGEPFKKWLPIFAGKIVNLWFDSDHARKHPTTGMNIQPAGFEAMRRAGRLLRESKTPPLEINYCHWGEAGFDPALPSGTDVRDILTQVGA